MNITLRNQSFAIKLAKDEELPNNLLAMYQAYGLKADIATGKRPITQSAYSYSMKENTFYYPLHTANTIIGGLKAYRKHFTETMDRVEDSFPVDINMAFKLEYRGNQKEYVDAITSRRLNTYLVALHPGGGKANSNDTLLPTPNGKYERMGDIKVGSRIYGSKGMPITVTGVYPQGTIDIFEITYIDGTKEECSYDHLHPIYNGSEFSTLTTKELIFNFSKGKLFKPLNSTIVVGGRSNGERLDLFKMGKDIMSFIDVMDTASINYTHEDRLRLISGILLSNTYIETTTSGMFTFNNKRVALLFMDLKRADGKLVKLLSLCNEFYTVKESIGAKWKQIVSIKLIGRKEATCITVDAKNKLYLINDFIVTHNTVIASKSLEIIGERFLIILKAGYISKWKKDLSDLLGFTKDDIFIFSGMTSFYEWLEKTDEERDRYKCMMVSSTTSGNLMKAYDAGEEVPIAPNNLLAELRCNVMLTDEVHQHFDSISKSIIRFNPKTAIALSATLIHKKISIQNIYNAFFPTESQLSLTLYVPYMDLYLTSYSFIRPKQVRYQRFGIGYSQNMLEEYIIRSPDRLNNFFLIIEREFEMHFLDRASKEDKCLLLVSSREMAIRLTSRLLKKYKLDVRRNMGGDSYEDLMEARVIVATTGKAGAAVDIKDLYTMINIVCSDSLQFNIQAPGRLRERDGKELRYVQLYADAIPQHHRYMRDVVKLLSNRYSYIYNCVTPLLV